MAHDDTLLLEDNLNDLDELRIYKHLKMIGCIFAETKEQYYKLCKQCGLDKDSDIHNILFDLNTRFLIHAYSKNENNCINRILSEHVYPGKFEIDIDNYEVEYSSNDYFDIVDQIIEGPDD